MNKLKLLDSFCNSVETDNSYDAIIITETWLNADIADSTICPNGFHVIRNDRTHSRGGGVLILFKSHLKVSKIEIPVSRKDNDFEMLCVDIYDTHDCFRFACFYIPPITAMSVEKIKAICSVIQFCCSGKHPTFILGDFNLPGIDWTLPISNGGFRRLLTAMAIFLICFFVTLLAVN